jgi:DNA-binding MarR family transcriptional regulator
MSLDLFYARAGHLIRRLNQIAVAIFLEETAELGLTTVQYAALHIIDEKPGIDQVTLSSLVAFDKTTLVKVINRLVEKGLITRKLSSRDRRRHELTATSKGSEIIRKIVSMIDRSEQRILAPLNSSERRQFLGLASRLVQVNNVYSRAPMNLDLVTEGASTESRDNLSERRSGKRLTKPAKSRQLRANHRATQ